MTLAPDLLARFAAVTGPANAFTADADTAPYVHEWRDRWTGRAALVLRPADTAELAAIVKLAAAHRVALVPQGGNTGLVGGQIPDMTGDQVVVSLTRLNRIRAVDAPSLTLIAEAGVTLKAVQDAAEAAGLLFPLSLGAEGTATIGGNLSTNAGGTAVLAYGNARDLALGLELVLPDGEIWNGLRTLRKDNTGYDLKNLFIGAEGTLGFITAASLKLFPRPRRRATIIAATPSPQHALDALALIRDAAPGTVTSFELMPRIGLDFVLRHVPGTRDPLSTASPWYVLIEISSQTAAGFDEGVESALAEALEGGALTDAVPASSDTQARAFWHLRESMSGAQKGEGGSIKHDVSVPVASVPAFIAEGIALATALIPGARPVPFGHLGDGNIHFNITQPLGAETAAFLAQWETMNAAIHGLVARFGGSLSAEHGIGAAKRDLLPGVKSAVEMDLMRRVKAMLDPLGIMNPGKILAPSTRG
ncbi:putative FAD-linked oxidoreductase [Alphaproteobacteria bacterium SO-S41]|nr:putative FAD-linked oxidoreductase [Alphaproteobacteria bacterium SO-S41]